MILKDISDRKRATKYGTTELQILIAITILSILKTHWFDKDVLMKVRIDKIVGKRIFNFECLSIITALAIDFGYFQAHPTDNSHYILMTCCALMTMASVILLSGKSHL